MKIILYAFSLIYIAAGVCMILYTDETRNMFKRLVQMGLKAMSVIAAAMGLLLILAASASHYPWVLRIIGLVALAEGVLLFINPQDIMGKIYDWFLEQASEQTFRATGIITVIFGTALISWIA
jgi:uncharacterized protein YjeT (DUF2065 family)